MSYFGKFEGVGEVLDKAIPSKSFVFGTLALIFTVGAVIGFVIGAS